MTRIVIGVDVAKDRIDVFHPATGARRYAGAEGLADFARAAAGDGALVVFEATGRYDRPLRQALAAAGVAQARINPARVRDFARASGRLAKTDRLDAELIAGMGRRMELVPDPGGAPDALAAHGDFKDLVARRRQLVEFRKQERTRLRQPAGSAERHSLQRHLAWLDAEIATLEAALEAAVAADAARAEAVRRLCTAPGIGRLSAAALVADLPELGGRDRRRIAALAGLAPVARDSGQRKSARAIRGGRPPVRRTLYLAALTAARCDPELAACRKRLQDRGKSAKQALIAIARKLLTRLNAMLRSGTDYAPT